MTMTSPNKSSTRRITVPIATASGDMIEAWVYLPESSGPHLRIPRPSGHLFHEHPATDSTVIRPPIPRTSGHP